MNRCCPNAITESRSEIVGFYRMNKGVCLPGNQQGMHCFTDRYSGTSPEQDLSRRNGVGNQYTIILCIALIVFFLVCRCLSPPDRRGSDDEFDDTDEELYYLQKCQASKNPLFIPIQSYSLAPALF